MSNEFVAKKGLIVDGNTTINGDIYSNIVVGALSGTIDSTTTAVTQTTGDNSTKVATTEFVTNAVVVEDLWDRIGTTLSPTNSADDVSIGTSITVSGDINQLPTSPIVSGVVNNPSVIGAARGLVIQGNYLYATSSSQHKMNIWDITNELSPQLVGAVTSGLFQPSSIDIYGDYVVVGDDTQIVVIDVSKKTAPVIVKSITANPSRLKLQGHYLFETDNGLNIYDMTDVTQMNKIGSVTNASLAGDANGLDIVGAYAYIACRTTDTIAVVDVSDVTNPQMVGSLADSTNLDEAFQIKVLGRYAYLTCREGDSLTIVDIIDPTNPVYVGKVSDAVRLADPRDVIVINDYAFVTNYAGTSIQVINVSDKTNPVFVSELVDATNFVSIYYINSNGNYLYVGTQDKLVVVDVGSINFLTGNIGFLNAEQINADNIDISNNLIVGGGVTTGFKGINTQGDVSGRFFLGTLDGTITSGTSATTQSVGDSSTLIATTEFVTSAVSAVSVDDYWDRTGTILTPTNSGDIVSATTIICNLSGTIDGTTTAVTQTAGDNSTKVATTEYVDNTALWEIAGLNTLQPINQSHQFKAIGTSLFLLQAQSAPVDIQSNTSQINLNPNTFTYTNKPIKLNSLSASSEIFLDSSKQISNTKPTSGPLGYLNRTGNVLSPVTANDNFDINGNIVIDKTSVDPSLLLYLPMSEIGSDTQGDRSSNGYDGTIFGDVVCDPAYGYIGSGCQFGGTLNDYIALPDMGTLSGDFTISTWVKVDKSVDNGSIINLQIGGNNYLELWAGTVGGGGYSWKAYVGLAFLQSGVVVVDDEWTYIAITRVGSLNTLYVNGVAKASGIDGRTFTIATPGLGTRISGGGNPFKGCVDEAKVYTRALTEEELLTQTQLFPSLSVTRDLSVDGKALITDDVYLSKDLTVAGKLKASGSIYQPIYGDDSGLIWDIPFRQYGTAVAQIGEDPYGLSLVVDGSPVTSASFGPFGSGADFNGTDSGYNSPMANAPTGAEPWTVEIWFKTDVLTQDRWVYFLGANVTDKGYILRIQNQDLIVGAYGNEDTLIGIVQSVDDWYHVQSTYDGTVLKTYVNGVLKASKTVTMSILANNMLFAKDLFSNFYDGKISNFKLYDKALSEDELRTHYLRHGGDSVVKSNSFKVVDTENDVNFQVYESGDVAVTKDLYIGENLIATGSLDAKDATLAGSLYQSFYGDDSGLIWDIPFRQYGTAVAQIGEDPFGLSLVVIGNPVTSGSFGPFGSGADFNGTDAGYNSPMANAPTGAEPWTVELWFKTDVLTQDRWVYFLGANVTDKGYILRIQNNDLIIGAYGNEDTLTDVVESVDNWYFVQSTYDGTDLKTYLNGELKATKTITLDIIANNMMLAKDLFSNYYDGKITNFKLYDKALSEDELRTHYLRHGGDSLVKSNYFKVVNTNNDINFEVYGNGSVTTRGTVNGRDIATDGSNIDLNTTHRTSDGSDHTFINQDVTTTASPSFVDTTLSGSLYQPVYGTDELLKLHVPFSEIGTTTQYDYSGLGNTALIDSTTPIVSADSGEYGSAAVFDGSDRYKMTNKPISGTDQKFTYEAKFKVTTLPSAGNDGTIIVHRANARDSYITVLESGILDFTITWDDATASEVQTSSALTLNKYYVVTATYDGTYMRLYLDGVEIGSVDVSGKVNDFDTNFLGFYFGGDLTANSFFTGIIEDAKVYNRALSKDEARSHYLRYGKGVVKADNFKIVDSSNNVNLEIDVKGNMSIAGIETNTFKPITEVSSESYTNMDGAYEAVRHGSFLYVVSRGSTSITVFNWKANRAQPTQVGQTIDSTNLNSANGGTAYGNVLYTHSVSGILSVWDITDRTNPTFVTSITGLGEIPWAIVSDDGKVLYISLFSGSFNSYSLDNPLSPQLLQSLSGMGSGTSNFDLVGNTAFIPSYTANSLTIVNVTDPSAMTILGSVSDGTDLSGAQAVKVRGDYAFVGMINGVTSVLISDLTAPIIKQRITSTGRVTGLEVRDDTIITTGSNSISIVDITYPEGMSKTDQYTDAINLDVILRSIAIGRYIYAAPNDIANLTVLQMPGITTPRIGVDYIDTEDIYVSDYLRATNAQLNSLLAGDINVTNNLEVGGNLLLQNSDVVRNIYTAADYEALASGGVITVSDELTLNFQTQGTFAVASRLNVTAGGKLNIIGLNESTVYYVGGGTFLTSVDGIVNIDSINFVPAVPTWQFFDVVTSSFALFNVTIKNVSFINWSPGTINGSLVIGQDISWLDWEDTWNIENTVLFEMTRLIPLQLDQLSQNKPFINIKSLIQRGKVTITTTDGSIEPGESLIRLDAGITDDAMITLNGTSTLGDVFDTSSAGSGTFSAVADASVAPTAITSVIPSGSAARFNFTVGPTLFVGQEVVLSGFTGAPALYNQVRLVTATGAGYIEIQGTAFVGDGTGSFLSNSVTMTETTTTLSDGDTVTTDTDNATNYDGGTTIYNKQPNSFQVNKTWTVTHTGTWSKAGLDQRDIRVLALSSSRSSDSKKLGTGFMNGNVTNNTTGGFPITNTVYTDVVLGTGAGGLVSGSNIQRWKVIDSITGEMEYTGNEIFDGSIDYHSTGTSSGGTVEFRYKWVIQPSGGSYQNLPDDKYARVDIGTTPSGIGDRIPLVASKGDRIKPQITRQTGASSITTTDFSVSVEG